MQLDWLIKKKLEKAQYKRKRACCKDKNNLKYAMGLNNRPDRVVLKCRVCGGVHRHTAAEKGDFGFRKK